MKKQALLAFIILLSGVGLSSGQGTESSKAPPITISLEFNKAFYGFDDPVGARVTASNTSREDIVVTRSFSAYPYLLRMRVVDPAGRLLHPKRQDQRDVPLEIPDAPPLPWTFYRDKPVQTAPCEIFEGGRNEVQETADLRQLYDLVLPGHYSAQVQVSAMTFKGDGKAPCDVNDRQWLGVIHSETVHFYYEGKTEVEIPPWWDVKKLPSELKVVIWPPEGGTVDAYHRESIRLNGAAPTSIRVEDSPERKQHCLVVTFDAERAAGGLPSMQPNHWQPATITGRLKSGEPFGGSRQIVLLR
ncbi:MAG: hypothetical protein GX443_07375 [Deltaproteobacteria bacterium]|nr:hypothetical protein [Deltaproteobacteria bacterium]